MLDDITLKAQKIDIPTLIIWGDEDKIISVKNAYALHEHMKKSQLVILKGIGHMPMIEEPEVTAKHIMNFLND
ncbi:MAG: alpha/beta hydrolase [Campylobacterota bacterium]|nr:alpha/beta hydrolase [Campylobacterota bacterium]